MKPVASREAIDGVQQMHRALHMALDALENRDEPERAAEILRQIDVAMVDWIEAARFMR
ncbi:hypothetical protein JMM63_08000 [Rhodovulum sulfidophilum]|uniref:Uncharacterized protein n=1 Tax=Rhodovulum sulfidophilum TaxID=35806 RepID=A0A0D6AZK4_RHOSU|nr:hypothetical protein [Rhodovulum sulfidophilum]MBL3564030.1 hypothetical protein [Rhodovulum sulfidophilum]MBL3573610.1 hypothetical protein [Rhodovulum sulfidophilum]MBL3585331.1 hypothetical protein [Rhodovulum sulfidophilum]MBL3595510.1 hypothetical protein [Rhodovulum sulfidophilum]MCE8430151.1 hypothetical protein [Rhodovulum sulfidophilum]